MKNLLRNQRGFMLLNVVFLTLITSFVTMLLLNAAPRLKSPEAVLRLTALHLADEQLAMLESMAATEGLAAGSYAFMGRDEDLTTENAFAGEATRFEVKTTVTAEGTLRYATVTVSWEVGEEIFELETERTIRVVEES